MIKLNRQWVKRGSVIRFAVKANLTDPKQKQCLSELFGQLSDGYWENDTRMERFWTQIEYDPKTDYIVVVRNFTISHPIQLQNGAEVGHWLALKLKHITKVWFEHHQDEIEDIKAFTREWRMGSNRVISYLSHPLDVTVKDIKATFNALENIKESDTVPGTEVEFN